MLVTALGEGGQAMARRPNFLKSQDEIGTIYGQLNSFIDNLDCKIIKLLEAAEFTYSELHKEQVKTMTKELTDIKARIDEAQMKERANKKMFVLEEERDYFRHKVTQLDAQIRKVEAENEKTQKLYKEAKEEISNYKKICFKMQETINKLKGETLQIYKIKLEDLNLQKENSDKVESQLRSKPQSQLQTRGRATSTHFLPKYEDSPQVVQSTWKRKTSIGPILGGSTSRKKEYPDIGSPRMSAEIEEILSSCIKQLKKEIFYRNLKADKQDLVYFDEDKQVSFEKFRKTDKKELIQRLMSDPAILDRFYEFLVGKQEQQQQTSQTQQHQSARQGEYTVKPFDAQHNTNSLSAMKRKFEDRLLATKSKNSNPLESRLK